MSQWSELIHHFYGKIRVHSPYDPHNSDVEVDDSFHRFHDHVWRVNVVPLAGQSNAWSIRVQLHSPNATFIEKIGIPSVQEAYKIDLSQCQSATAEVFGVSRFSLPPGQLFKPFDIELVVTFRKLAHQDYRVCLCAPPTTNDASRNVERPPDPPTQPTTLSALSLSADLAKQLGRADTADIQFIFGNDNAIAAHKWILQARLPYFETLFSSGMRESTTNRIEIEDADVESFRGMLKFVYCGQLPENLKATASGILPLAEKYDIEELKTVCASTLRHNLAKENAIETLILSDVYRCPKLKEHCVKNLASWKRSFNEEELEPLKEYPHLLIKILTFKDE